MSVGRHLNCLWVRLVLKAGVCELMGVPPPPQMYGRYTQELGEYAKEEAARLRESGPRRSISERRRTLDLLEYDKGRCAKCRSKYHIQTWSGSVWGRGCTEPDLLLSILVPSSGPKPGAEILMMSR